MEYFEELIGKIDRALKESIPIDWKVKYTASHNDGHDAAIIIILQKKGKKEKHGR